MTARVGIDLGTTYSLVAHVSAGAPRILPNAVGGYLTPSAVYVAEDGSVLVGEAARAHAATHPERTALSFKRDMGTNRRYDLGGKTFRAEELSALVLGELRRDAEAALGESVTDAVVTVPAYFGEAQRRATRDACEMAGLPVERIINEPTAAALAYGLHQQHREFRAVVLDLGGGTFDVTVLEVMEGVIEIQSSAGDTRLGGEDFLDVLVAHTRAKLKGSLGVELGDSELTRARLREACEHAKRRLSSDERALVALPELETSEGFRDVELTLERGLVELEYRALLDRMVAPIQRALRDAGKTPREIDEVLLVGGATRMPPVVRLASQLFGRLPLRTLPADEAVALGAAVQVELKAGEGVVGDLVVTDVAPFSLGIASGTHASGAVVTGIFSPILERGTVLPASRVERFSTMGNNQREIKVEVYQGEHSLCEQNEKIGEYTIKGIPARPAGEEGIDVRFSYDMNGVLDVDATIVSTGKTASFTIERSPGRLSKKDVEETRQRLSRLKLHPRDALPNTTALSRADAIFRELTGDARSALGQRIASFRAALAGQDQRQIEGERAELIALTQALASRIGRD